jgi:divalent metal cation (Fe/Co/Zn/Cd) transporter
VYVDLHIQVDPDRRTEDTHAIAHEVQQRLRQHYPEIQDVTIHVEPFQPEAVRIVQPEVALEIRSVAKELGLGAHDLWVYENGGQYYADVHVEADGNLLLCNAHDLVTELEKQAREQISGLEELTIHIEPRGETARIVTPQWAESDIVQTVQTITKEVLDGDSIHHIHVRRGREGYTASMHCTLPGDITLTEAHRISTQLEVELRSHVPGLERVIIHTEPAD